MAFEKAQQLLELATFAASRKGGVSLDEVTDRFGVSRRTAQRMMQALETRFVDAEAVFDAEGRKRWKLQTAALAEFLSLSADELAALDISIETLEQNALAIEAKQLRQLREKVLALVPHTKMVRVEPDYEALLEAQGLACRPGPAARIEPELAAKISTAIKRAERLRISYRSQGAMRGTARVVEPYGILIGIRRYLVARPKGDRNGPFRYYVTERIQSAELAGEQFERERGFDIHKHAHRAFGAFQNEAEFGEVIWKFKPDAASHARAFSFHPTQVLEDLPDGSLVVRFSASGHLEMCWHLYMWGDRVEVIAPRALRKMVQAHRRTDFPALP